MKISSAGVTPTPNATAQRRELASVTPAAACHAASKYSCIATHDLLDPVGKLPCDGLNLGESLRVVGGTVNANVPMKNAVDPNCLGDHAVLVFGEGVPMGKSDRDMVAQPEFPHKVR